MDKEKQLVEAVLKSVDNGREANGRKSLTCAGAFKLAEEFEMDVIKIGRLCNKHNIKIRKCQLGCFK
jgi:hypothetical protein